MKMKQNLIISAIVAVVVVVFAVVYTTVQGGGTQSAMGASSGQGAIPAVTGYADGQKIRFIHTEASEPGIAQMLTKMIGSPVITVPALVQAPDSMLANVYVFTNGIRPKERGPLGFQPDVFDNPPFAAGYSPLRALNQVTWLDEHKARLLMSASEVRDAEAEGDVTIKRTGVVVNMPLVTWPGGHR